MQSTRKAQRACPQCSAQLLALFENTFRPQPNFAFSRRPSAPRRVARWTPRPALVQPFSTTRWLREDVRQDGPEPDVDDASPLPTPLTEVDEVEFIVRQAKQTFGNTLPKGFLNEEEYKVYERLYGPPLRETAPEDVALPLSEDMLEESQDDSFDPTRKVLLRVNEDGQLEELTYHTEPTTAPEDPEASGGPEGLDAVETVPFEQAAQSELPSDAGMDYVNAVANNQREYDALIKLQKEFEVARMRPLEEDVDEAEEIEEEQEDVDEELEEDEDERGDPDAIFGPPEERFHPHSLKGHWGPNPATVFLPKQDFVEPITELLKRTDITHVQDAAEKAFGGPGLPFAVSTRRVLSAEQKPIAMQATQLKMSEIEADAYMAAILPGLHASVLTVLAEVRKRLGSQWLRGLISRGNGEGPRVLDAGAGGAGLTAWQEVLQAEWELLQDEGGVRRRRGPPGKKTVVIGNENLRHRVSRFLHNTSFLPRLPDYLHSGDLPNRLDGETAQAQKVFDVIIAPHTLMPLKEGYQRRDYIDNLWEMLSPEGGILILIEKGHPRGFEAIADVRSRLLRDFIVTPTSDPQPEPIETEKRREREPGLIVAPCTNHKECPMYLTPGLSPGRKDFCHFRQRFIRPPFLQKILNATHRNHEDVEFSFVVVQRGSASSTDQVVATHPKQGRAASDAAFKGFEKDSEAPNALSLPRVVLRPLKRKGHITLDVCTPSATIERWVVPKSFSKQAYRDARKSSWGDLWALGAKTRTPRAVRLGKGVVNGEVVPNDGGVRARAAAAALKGRPRVISVETDGREVNEDIPDADQTGKRWTRIGRKAKSKRKLRLNDLKEAKKPSKSST